MNTLSWEQRRLGEIANKSECKNVKGTIRETFTNSAELGLIVQSDYFNHQVSNISNINKYLIVYKDDFVYNPRISTNAPVGPINRNKLKITGVVSPIYTVFRIIEANLNYFDWYFAGSCWHNYMFYNGDTGARSDRFSIKMNLFFDMPISLPSIPEQKLIGEFFRRLDDRITHHQRKLEKLKIFKKAMLEKMFV